uniref:Uncharacterized protein n=1 Tax=Octopus bimaculoides TaxID=37653 RepID=A0A0L8IHW4_OCTBM
MRTKKHNKRNKDHYSQCSLREYIRECFQSLGRLFECSQDICNDVYIRMCTC